MLCSSSLTGYPGNGCGQYHHLDLLEDLGPAPLELLKSDVHLLHFVKNVGWLQALHYKTQQCNYLKEAKMWLGVCSPRGRFWDKPLRAITSFGRWHWGRCEEVSSTREEIDRFRSQQTPWAIEGQVFSGIPGDSIKHNVELPRSLIHQLQVCHWLRSSSGLSTVWNFQLPCSWLERSHRFP